MGQGRTPATPGALRRLTEELAEAGLDLDGSQPWHDLARVELDYARRPKIHERRIPSYGAFIAPSVSSWAWEESTELTIERRPIGDRSTDAARRFADGVSSWMIRHVEGRDEWAVFDRPAGSERDLVVLSEALGAVVVQRHPAGLVRVVGDFGVYRWDNMTWHHEPRVATWMEAVTQGAGAGTPERQLFETLLEFAVHDLGARNIGATLIYKSDPALRAGIEQRLPTPPPLKVKRPADLAPLRHVLAQIDGAALFDEHGTLVEIGVRLVPSLEAEADVEGFRGMRHTSARRYSFDDPHAIVIVISEEGPVTVLKGGRKLGESYAPPVTPDEGEADIIVGDHRLAHDGVSA
jgi:hypothetical protein